MSAEENIDYPLIYLAIDNCFASKRWTRQKDWMGLINSMGIEYIEASADTECDPLYMGQAYLRTWSEELHNNCEQIGVKVANLYSGHGTYATLGLGHDDMRVRERMLNEWILPFTRTAAEIGAGLGFFCHAFSNEVLQNPGLYRETEQDLCRSLARAAVFAAELGVPSIGVEQMYTPHQIPWTVHGAERLLGQIFRIAGQPFYLTIDTGHQGAQRNYLRPTAERVREALRQIRNGKNSGTLWLGSEAAMELFTRIAESSAEGAPEINLLEQEMDRNPHLFSVSGDEDTYIWLEKLGRYSPIIHLQQSKGTTSAHLPFTEEHNIEGKIRGDAVLAAIQRSYTAPAREDMPPPCRKIYLTLEIFPKTEDFYPDILERLKKSVRYWRTFVPEDGLRLDQLIQKSSD